MIDNNKYLINKETSIFFKGIAILLMLIHHMFTFPNWIIAGRYTANLTFAHYFNVPTRICVGIFAFVSGWAFVLRKQKRLGWVVKKIIGFYITYWIAFVVILIFAICCCNFHPNILYIIKELSGFSNELMKFCWYVPFYMISLFILYMLYHKIDRSFFSSLLWGIIIPIIGFILIEKLVPIPSIARLSSQLKHYFPCISMGYICNKYNIFRILQEYTRKISPWLILIVSCIFTFIGRYYIKSLDFIYAPIIVFGITNIVQREKKNKCSNLFEEVIILIGKQSTNMWFLHCVIFSSITNSYIQPYVYWSSNPLIVFASAVIILYILSYFLTIIDKKIIRYIS